MDFLAVVFCGNFRLLPPGPVFAAVVVGAGTGSLLSLVRVVLTGGWSSEGTSTEMEGFPMAAVSVPSC